MEVLNKKSIVRNLVFNPLEPNPVGKLKARVRRLYPNPICKRKIRDMDNMPDWSGLLPDLLIGITIRLPLMDDFTAFRGVCTNWRAAAAMKTDLFKGVSKVPLLMLAEKDDSDEREFYSLFKRKILFTMAVPEAQGQRCIDAGFGWILAISASPSSIGEICLFNPFSPSAKIELANLYTFSLYVDCPTDPEYFFINRGILSADPSLTSDFTVFVVGNSSLGLWRNGDKGWTKINVRLNFGQCGGLCYYKGKLYTSDVSGEVFIWDPYFATTRMIRWKDPSVIRQDWMPYLVESSDGELLIILSTNYEWREIAKPTRFELMRVDVVKMECEEIKGIGKEAVFLGDNTPVSIIADDFPGVKPNCIYFTDDCWQRYLAYFSDDEEPIDDDGGREMGNYNVEHGSIEKFNVESFSKICPPLWIFPSF